MPKTAKNTAIAALLALGSVASSAKAGGNPWNPFPIAPPNTQTAPLAQPVAPQVAPLAQPEVTSRFAPAGLEQQLAAAPLAQYAPLPEDELQVGANQVPPRFAPQSLSAPQKQAQGFRPSYFQGPGNGRYPQGYAPFGPQGYGAPQGYGPQGYTQNFNPGYWQGYNPGNGGNSSFGPFASPSIPSIPGGFGGNFPFPGNITNGGVPGFNLSPFGLF